MSTAILFYTLFRVSHLRLRDFQVSDVDAPRSDADARPTCMAAFPQRLGAPSFGCCLLYQNVGSGVGSLSV